MAEANGHQDNLSRLDRIERAIEHIIDEHEMFRDEHKKLLQSQVLLQNSLELLRGSLESQKVRIDEIGDKLNGLIDIVDRDHREYHERLNRLEQK